MSADVISCKQLECILFTFDDGCMQLLEETLRFCSAESEGMLRLLVLLNSLAENLTHEIFKVTTKVIPAFQLSIAMLSLRHQTLTLVTLFFEIASFFGKDLLPCQLR